MSLVLSACPRCAGPVESLGADTRCIQCGWGGATRPAPPINGKEGGQPMTFESLERFIESERVRQRNANRRYKARRTAGGGQ